MLTGPARRRSIMRLKNKVAIITGGAHGMGEAEVRLFAAEGAKVIVADILASDAETVAADIRAGDGEATAAKIDVTNEAEWIGLIANAVATYGRLDILVNNAGISGSSVGDHNGLEGWHRIIAVNQTSVLLGARRADGKDWWRLDRQHQLDHGIRWQHQRSSGVSRLKRRRADLLQSRRGPI